MNRLILSIVFGSAFTTAAAAEPARVVALGDSITKGSRPGVAVEKVFAALLQTALTEKKIDAKVVNVGIGGERTDQALVRLQRDVLSTKPRVVVVMYGTNDSYVDRGKSASRITVEQYRANLDDTLGFMDTVGNGQLEVRDVEAAYPSAKYDPADIDYYLRNVTHYLLGLDREMKSGEDIDGPGESNLSWTLEVLDQGAIEPPRRVLRLYPKASSQAVRAALSAVGR